MVAGLVEEVGRLREGPESVGGDVCGDGSVRWRGRRRIVKGEGGGSGRLVWCEGGNEGGGRERSGIGDSVVCGEGVRKGKVGGDCVDVRTEL